MNAIWNHTVSAQRKGIQGVASRKAGAGDASLRFGNPVDADTARCSPQPKPGAEAVTGRVAFGCDMQVQS